MNLPKASPSTYKQLILTQRKTIRSVLWLGLEAQQMTSAAHLISTKLAVSVALPRFFQFSTLLQRLISNNSLKVVPSAMLPVCFNPICTKMLREMFSEDVSLLRLTKLQKKMISAAGVQLL